MKKARKPRVEITPLMSELITTLYINGVGYRSISDYLQQHLDVTISHQSIAKFCRNLSSEYQRQKITVINPRLKYKSLCRLSPYMLTRLDPNSASGCLSTSLELD